MQQNADDAPEWLTGFGIGKCPKVRNRHCRRIDGSVPHNNPLHPKIYSVRASNGERCNYFCFVKEHFHYTCLFPDLKMDTREMDNTIVEGRPDMGAKLSTHSFAPCCLAKAAYYIVHVKKLAKFCVGRSLNETAELLAYRVKDEVSTDTFRRAVAKGLHSCSSCAAGYEVCAWRPPA